MIFNNTILTEGELTTKESPYDLTLEGALMHVYENECNYNELMKAVGISELRYYNDTGKELFVEEANAFEKFINSVKKFFTKIIEGIKSIFNKFMSFIRSKLSDDKAFLKKYEDTLNKKTEADLKDVKFKGYKFPKLEDWKPQESVVNLAELGRDGQYTYVDNDGAAKIPNNDNEKDDALDVQRFNIAGTAIAGNKGKLTKSEFANVLKENLIGKDKEEFNITVDIIKDSINHIKTAKTDIAKAKASQTYICGIISQYIKTLDSAKKLVKAENDKTTKSANLKRLNKEIAKMKSASNDYTMAYGKIIDALKTRNSQSKAICVKAISAKAKENNSSTSSSTEEAVISNLFASVVIR